MTSIRRSATRVSLWVAVSCAALPTQPDADLHAQDGRLQARRIEVSSPQFIALMVADLEASTRWYREVFGVTIEAEFELPGATGRGRLLRAGNLLVEVIADRRAGAMPIPAADGLAHPVHGIFKAGIQVASLADALAVLRQHGTTIVGAWPGSRPPNALIRDNSGNLLQLFEGRP